MYQVFEIYSHKFAVFVVASSPNELMELQSHNPEMDIVSVLDLDDFLLLHEKRQHMSVRKYLEENPHPHIIGHCFTESFEFAGGTVEVVRKYIVERGIDIVWFSKRNDE